MNIAHLTQARVRCSEHGDVSLTEEQYHEQLMNAGARWKCPQCSRPADFDDHHWQRLHREAYRGLLDNEEI